MDYERFITIVEQGAGIGREEAVRAAQATLQTLAERIDRGEARDLADELPAELAPWIATTTPPEGFDLDEFVRRVAEREGVDEATAERHARVVFDAMGRAISPKELFEMLAELPVEYAPMLPRGPYVDVISAERFWRRVAERAGADDETARRATDAVLETLAERIAGGEVQDLIDHLPIPLHPPLRRGREHSGGKALRMSLDEFLDRVMEREGVDSERAIDHTRAVLATLREAVGDEFLDVRVQLPADYEPVLTGLRTGR
jgi:uncharacterized protein (DUF2267 family)